MKRLFIIFLSCLCLTACHKDTTTKSTEKTTAEDSILLESIKKATLQYVDQLNQQHEEDPIEPTNVSVRWSLYPDKMVLVLMMSITLWLWWIIRIPLSRTSYQTFMMLNAIK